MNDDAGCTEDERRGTCAAARDMAAPWPDQISGEADYPYREQFGAVRWEIPFPE